MRRKTERIAEALRQQLAGHLETLRPVLAPERVFGRLAGGKTDVLTADRALKDLREKYATFGAAPYNLSAEFDPGWLSLTGNALELFPWEYTYLLGTKKITMTSAARWVLNFKSNCPFARVRAAAEGAEPGRPDVLRQFVVNSLALAAVIRANPGLFTLFADLRHELKIESPAELKGLPVITLSANVSSFRPADDLITAATAFSGVPAFVELLDLESLASPRDPFKERLAQLVAG